MGNILVEAIGRSRVTWQRVDATHGRHNTIVFYYYKKHYHVAVGSGSDERRGGFGRGRTSRCIAIARGVVLLRAKNSLWITGRQALDWITDLPAATEIYRKESRS
jgi:hypothetical protein